MFRGGLSMPCNWNHAHTWGGKAGSCIMFLVAFGINVQHAHLSLTWSSMRGVFYHMVGRRPNLSRFPNSFNCRLIKYVALLSGILTHIFDYREKVRDSPCVVASVQNLQHKFLPFDKQLLACLMATGQSYHLSDLSFFR